MVNRISSEKKVKKTVGTSKFEYTEDPLGDVLRTSWGHLESTSQGCPWNVRLGRPLDVISERPQNVRLRRPQDVRSARPWDGQIGSLGTSWGRLRGTSSGNILTDLTDLCFTKQRIKTKNAFARVFCSALLVKMYGKV